MGLANMGVKKSESYGGWEVSYCYYGMSDGSGQYVTFNEVTRERVVIKPEARWSIEVMTPNTEATAKELWALRDRITAIVAERETTVPKATVEGPLAFLAQVWTENRNGVPQARLSAVKTAEGWTITEYDFGRWTATL